MKLAKLQLSTLALSSAIALAFFAILVIAPSITWTSDSDWNSGAHTNTTAVGENRWQKMNC